MEPDPILYQNNFNERGRNVAYVLKWVKIISIIVFVLGLLILFYFRSIPSGNFPIGEMIEIKNGESLSEISKDLESKKVISSAFIFQTYAILRGGDKNIVAGSYLFESPLDVFSVVKRIQEGIHGIERIKITLPEGSTILQMSEILKTQLPLFDDKEFLILSKNKEGYMFPDTYFFFKNDKTDEVFNIIKNNFDNKIASLEKDISLSGKSLKDIIIMASLIEKEAGSDSDRIIISSILWKRIEKGMPLQADATFLYILGKESKELTIDDLKTNSPYNTYTNKGLPPSPISNPGLESIKASMKPNKTEFLYYLHGRDGVIHTAKTFEEHKKNKQKYL